MDSGKRQKPITVKLTWMQAEAIRVILDDALQPQKIAQPWRKEFPHEWAKWRNIAWNAKNKIEVALWPEDM